MKVIWSAVSLAPSKVALLPTLTLIALVDSRVLATETCLALVSVLELLPRLIRPPNRLELLS